MQLVKIDQVISVYLSITGMAVKKNHIPMAESSENSNHSLLSTKLISTELLLQRKLSLIRVYNQVI